MSLRRVASKGPKPNRFGLAKTPTKEESGGKLPNFDSCLLVKIPNGEELANQVPNLRTVGVLEPQAWTELATILKPESGRVEDPSLTGHD
jgi:hypothetical protein